MLIVFSFLSNGIKAQQLDSITLDTLQGYTSIQEALKEPDKVVKLVLRKNKLKVFPPEIFKFKNLQYLDLSKNSIKEIPAEIDTLKNLQVLMLSKNNLESLPKEIGSLINLRILNVNQNEIAELPPQIGDLENLEVLDLWDNNISDFPSQISYLKKLKMVDLRAILIDEEAQQHIQSLVPGTKIFFSPSCKCKTQ
jgi:leucine-rich repeat protein SHOC2